MVTLHRDGGTVSIGAGVGKGKVKADLVDKIYIRHIFKSPHNKE